jgi:two-component system, sensor histidine kinase and response regulator
MRNPSDSDGDGNQALMHRIRELEEENRRLKFKAQDVASANVNAAMQLLEMTEQRSQELEAKNAEIASALQHAEQASLKKSRFLANMSHELRTPISGIIGMSELLAEGELSAQQRDRVGAIISTADSFLDLVNQLLDFSKAEANAIEIEQCEYDVWSIGETVAQLLQVQADEKGVDFAFHLDCDLPRYLIGDRLRVRQVLLNLGVNAIKFTQHGCVTMRGARVCDADREWVEWAIADTGCGFDEPTGERLFEPFVQADASTTRRFGGTGLGLSICRHLVGCMGGEIRWHSEPDLGSTFVARLPMVVAKVAEPSLPLQRTARLLAARSSTIMMMSEHLPKHGYRVLHEDDPGSSDLLVVEAATQLVDVLHRARSRYPNQPVLLVESPGTVSLESDFGSSGVLGILQQPVRPTQLSSLLSLSGCEVAVGNAAIDRPAYSQRLALIADDSPINLRVLAERLRKQGLEVVEACDGQQAIDAFRQQHFDIVFLDCQMPVVDGYEAATTIRAIERAQNAGSVPIIALTADASDANEERCLHAGMDMFCIKPLRAEALSKVLSQWIVVVPAV